MDLSSTHVACVIVTYNRLGLLKNTVAAVTGQTRKPETIVIVDNCSTDGTRDWLQQLASGRSDIMPVLLDTNIGGAGGFHHGIKRAYETGADWIWTMDDDVFPLDDALEQLLEPAIRIANHDTGRIGFLASQVNWRDGCRHVMNTPHPSADWWYGHPECPGCIRLWNASFVSILISRIAVERVGYPVKEFFIWFDDVEYTRRIYGAGLPSYYIESSKVEHVTPANQGVEYKHIVQKDLWKWKYGVRNHVALSRAEGGKLRALATIGNIVRLMWVHDVPVRLQIPLFWAGISGFFFNYRKYIIYPVTEIP